MSFYACLSFAIISLCLGGVAGCLFCAGFARIFHKKFLKARISVIFLLLSVVVAFGAGGFIFIKNPSFEFSVFLTEKFFFFAIFAAGFLGAVFWKIVFPALIAFYIALSAFTGIALYSEFGILPDNMSVTLNKTFIEAGKSTFFVDSPENKSLAVEVYILPKKLLIPLPRVWYRVIGTVDSSYVDDGKNIRLSSDFSGEILPDENSKNSQKDSLFEKKIKAYRKWVLKTRKNLLVPLPQNELLPSVYTLKFKRKTEILSCRLEKNL